MSDRCAHKGCRNENQTYVYDYSFVVPVELERCYRCAEAMVEERPATISFLPPGRADF